MAGFRALSACAVAASPESGRRLQGDKNLSHPSTHRQTGRPYKSPEERIKSKKWEKRKLFFEIFDI